MQIRLRRYRWWLLLVVAIAGLASWCLWPKSVMREKYDRIRLGMPLDEVSMGFPPSERSDVYLWEQVAVDGVTVNSDGTTNEEGVEPVTWVNGSVAICVGCRDGKAVMKTMLIEVPPWKVKVREWLYWLRGLVGRKVGHESASKGIRIPSPILCLGTKQ